MKKASFPIYTNLGAYLQQGHISEFFGVHRKYDRDPWTVTYLPTGTKVDSLFPERFNNFATLAARVAVVENLVWSHLAALSDLPFGTASFPDTHRPTAVLMLEIVKANP